jgi:3-oxoacyl-(acyl-carrier-protein) synthase
MTPLWIDQIGMVTSAGLTTAQTMGSLLTRTCRPKQIPLLGPDGEALRVFKVPLETGLGSGLARLIGMTRLAVAECAGARENDEEPLPLVLSCPGEEAFAYNPAALVRAVDDVVDVASSRILPGGTHAAIGVALREARKLLALGKHRACYVGAVDTMLDKGRLARLMAASRILSSERAPGGFIPGEGAAVLRVSLSRDVAAAVCIAGVGLEVESATRESGKVTGFAQAAAARSALAEGKRRIEDVSLVATDLTGGRHRFYEAALATTRLRPSREQAFRQVSLGPLLGEVGCALGAISVAYLAVALHRRWTGTAPGAAMYLGADDDALRAAVLLRREG